MKTMLKKLTAITLSLIIIFSILFSLPVSAYARETITSGDFIYIVNDEGTVSIVEYTGSDADLVIPNTIDGKKVTRVAEEYFKKYDTVTFLHSGPIFTDSNKGKIENIVISDGISTLGSHAFDGCNNLRSIIIPDSVKTINIWSFRNCASLESLKIPYGVWYISTSLCENCTKLTDVIIPETVRRIYEEAFYNCENLRNVYIPEGVKYGVQYIEKNAFYGCPNLTFIRIPKSIIEIEPYALGYTEINGVKNKVENFTISGYKNTAAETYAKENGFNFIEICSNENMVTQVVKPTCTEYGYTVHTCQDCGDTYKSDFTYSDPLAHDDEIISKTDSTCTSTGSIDYICKVCGYKHTETIPKLPHTYEERVIEPSCSKDGQKIYRCTKCGYTYTEAIPTLPHSFIDTVIEPTACTDGYTLHKCSICGYEYTDEIVHVDNPVHNFKDGICTVCGKSDIYLYQSEHNYSPNTDKTWTVSRDNAAKLYLIFSDKTETEEMFDYIYIYDSDDNLVGEYTGTMLAGQIVTVKGDTAKIRLVTDGLNSDFYGFSLTYITAIYKEHIKGDVNGDGEVTVADATDIQKNIADLLKFDEQQKSIADINGDGEITIADVTILQKYIAGLVETI